MTTNDNEEELIVFAVSDRDELDDYDYVNNILEWTRSNYPGLNGNPVWEALENQFYAEFLEVSDRYKACE